MTVLESVLLAVGAVLVGRFLVASLVPAGWESLKARSEEGSLTLREEFLFLSPRVLQGTALLSGCTACLFVSGRFGLLPALLSGGAAAVAVPVILVRRMRASRRRNLRRQLPGTLRLLSASVRGGNSLPQALVQAVPLLPETMRKEVDWVCRKYRLGTPLVAVFQEWEERMGDDEFRIFLRPLRASQRTGGNVAELLDRCRQVFESRNRAAERLSAMTAQGRMQALVLSLLPPVLLLLLFRVDPPSRERLLHTTPGQALLCASAFLQCVGWFAVRWVTGTGR